MISQRLPTASDRAQSADALSRPDPALVGTPAVLFGEGLPYIRIYRDPDGSTSSIVIAEWVCPCCRHQNRASWVMCRDCGERRSIHGENMKKLFGMEDELPPRPASKSRPLRSWWARWFDLRRR